MVNKFSYAEYYMILQHIRKSNIPFILFRDYKDHDKFCVIRHDIEYSLERAHALGKFEYQHDVQSTYAVQLYNNNYNTLSYESLEYLDKLISYGHDIALHVHMDRYNNFMKLDEYIEQQIQILSDALHYQITTYSFHRPNKKWLIDKNGHHCKFRNLNAPPFFKYYESIPVVGMREVLYLADSNHQWKYGHPLDVDFNETVQKIQLNCHPFSWSAEGMNNTDNFIALTSEKIQDTVKFINKEIKNFPRSIYNAYVK